MFTPGLTQAILVVPFNGGRSDQLNKMTYPLGYYYPNQVNGLQQMLTSQFLRIPLRLNRQRTVYARPHLTFDGQNEQWDHLRSLSEDIVAINIERRYMNGRHYGYHQVMYANARDQGVIYRMGY